MVWSLCSVLLGGLEEGWEFMAGCGKVEVIGKKSDFEGVVGKESLVWGAYWVHWARGGGESKYCQFS